MKLDELQSVRDRERQTDKLQQLRESFYADAAEFIQQLRDERDRAAERADDPYGAPEVRQLSDEIETAEQTVEAIYEKRIGKIVKAASFDAAGLPSEADGMTTEEQDLFETLVDDIESSRERVLTVLDGEVPAESTDTPAEESAPPEESVTAPATQSGEEPVTAPAEGPAAQRSTTEETDPEVSVADVMGSADSTESDAAASGTPTGEDPATDHSPPEPPRGESPPDAPSPVEQSEPPVRNDGGRDTHARAQSGEETTPGDEPAQPGTDDGGTVERDRVLITDDVETFVGFDERDYDLAENDVVTLPSTNATLLVEQDVARELE